MKKTIILLIILFIGVATAISTDTKNDKDEKKKKPILYRLKQSFEPNLTQIYRMTEKTKVLRTYEDSTKFQYEREYTYFFSIRARGGYDETGYQPLFVSIDSLHYNYKDDQHQFNYTTTLGSKMPNHYDLTKTFAVNAIELEVKFSKYFDIAEIDGEMINWNRNYVTNEKTAPKNEFLRNMYQKRYSDKTFKHLIDLGKKVLPATEIEKDSAWTSELNIDINQASFKGYVSSKMNALRTDNYQIVTDIQGMKLVDEQYRLEDKKRYATIDSSKVAGTMKYKLLFGGQFEYIESNIDALLFGTVSNFKFKEEIHQENTWDLLGTYAYN